MPERLFFPSTLRLHHVEKDTKAPVPGIAIRLTIHTQVVNDYHLGPPLSDAAGIIEITEAWVRAGVEYERNTFIMDRLTPLVACSPRVEIDVMSTEDIARAVSGMQTWDIPKGGPDIANSIADLQGARNALYEPQNRVVALTKPKRKERDLTITVVRLKNA